VTISATSSPDNRSSRGDRQGWLLAKTIVQIADGNMHGR
jgi:hypothetical protein